MAGALDESGIEAERLRLIIRQFQRASFGRRSEQLDADQMAFGLEDLEADLARAEARKPPPAPAGPSKPRTAPHRTPLPSHLPHVEDVLPVPHDACPDCGGALTDAGSTSSERLDWIPAQLRVVRVTRPKCACRACGTLLQAPAPERVLAGGLATPGLIAHVLVSRYADHLPPYRQSQVFGRHGLAISRSTLSDWVGAACWWLEALHERVVPSASIPRAPHAEPWPASPTSWRASGCLPTTRPCRCSIPDGARPRPGGCGPTPGTTGPGVGQAIRPWCSPTRPTARRHGRPSISPASAASCRWTAMPGSGSSPLLAPSPSRPAGATRGGSSTSCTRRARRLRARRWRGLRPFTRSRPTSAASRRRSDSGSERSNRGRWSRR